jgi:protein-S-isoprenylcysteine O-methyltransferase Ste14
MKAFLAIRSIFFVVLLPGTVAGYVPFRLLRSGGQLRWPALSLSACLAALTTLVGAVVLLASVWELFAAGHGTLAPIDPPRQLVVSGLYRFTRNPMYNGVVAVLLGQAWLFSSVLLLEYAATVLVCFHLFVVLYEEPSLESRFGESYLSYRKAVPRWGFTIDPFSSVRW